MKVLAVILDGLKILSIVNLFIFMSQLNDALFNFGFKTPEVQEAFLENLYFAGYFNEDKIWQAINLMQYNKDGTLTAKWDNLRLTFLFLKRAISRAKANQSDHTKFSAKKLLDNFLVANIFDHQDVEDVVFYIAQNAFGRLPNQERSELAHYEWMDKYKEKYFINSKKLNLIDEINPTLTKYDECWIQGAARIRVITRMQYLKSLQDSGIDVGTVRLLTGARELWAEIAVVTDLSESKECMLKLAKLNNIKVNEDQPFIIKKIGNVDRTYLNYATNDSPVITETMMATKTYREIFGYDIEQVIDSAAAAGLMRPNTEQNAKDVALHLKDRINHNDFGGRKINILVVSNQPYCERQAITISRSIRKIITDCEIFCDGVGEAAAVGVAGIHSELGALVTEMFLRKIEQDNEPRKRQPEQLMFSSRYAPASEA